MKVDTSKASVIETESTKYFYIYEISCDGVVIPFNPKYLISYLLNDKLLLQSYSGDVYSTVRGTWGSLGIEDKVLEFSLTLEVNTIRMTIGELIDTIYNSYNFNSIDKVKKLILLAACSKAMLISLLYLIFYGIINNNDLAALCEFNFNDLYEYVLNKLKENCLTENPLETNFAAYIDEASYASGRFCEAKDAAVNQDESIKINVIKDNYKNIFKYNGYSVSYSKNDISAANKLSNSKTDWLYEIDDDVAAGKVVSPTRPVTGSGYKNITIKSMSSYGNLNFLSFEYDVVKNKSKHIIIKIPAGTKVKAPVFLWVTQELSIDSDIVLYPGDSINVKTKVPALATAFGIGNITLLDNMTIQVKEYANEWYQTIAEEIRLNYFRLLSADSSQSTAIAENTEKYNGSIKALQNIGSSNYNSLTINKRKITNNTPDLIFTIPDNTSIKISHWLAGAYDVRTDGEVTVGPGETKVISFHGPAFSEAGLNIFEILAVRAAKAVYNSVNKDSFNVTIYQDLEIPIKSSKYKPVKEADQTTISRRSTALLYGDQYTIENNGNIVVNGLAKVKSQYKTDLYKIDMTVHAIPDADYSKERTAMSRISNMLNLLSSSGSVSDTLEFTSQEVESKKIVTSSISTINSADINSFACADLTDDNPSRTIQVVPSNVLISPTENIGLTYRPRFTLNIGNTHLLTKENVEKLIDAMIEAESPVPVTPETENYIIKVEELKYVPVVDVEFLIPTILAKEAAILYSDLQFVLNYTDFELNINNKRYTTDGSTPNLTVEGVLTDTLTTVTAAELDARNKLSINLIVPMASKFKFTSANMPDTTSDSITFNQSAYNKIAAKHPANVTILKLRLTGADVLSTIDISEYNIFLYNGNFYKGSDMGV